MSHLSRRYTDYYYVEVEKKTFFGKKKKETRKVYYVSQSEKVLQAQEKALGISIPRNFPYAVFPCQHEERGFVSAKGKKSNHTHARYKRKNKARIRARKQK